MLGHGVALCGRDIFPNRILIFIFQIVFSFLYEYIFKLRILVDGPNVHAEHVAFGLLLDPPDLEPNTVIRSQPGVPI